jgi:hypothetical protein
MPLEEVGGEIYVHIYSNKFNPKIPRRTRKPREPIPKIDHKIISTKAEREI